MNSTHINTGSTHHTLTVLCPGRIELTQDDPAWGTYWTRYNATLGVCTNLESAMAIAERSIAQPPLTLIRVPEAHDFDPQRIVITDSERRRVLAGALTRYLVWLPPVTSDDETQTLAATAKRLREEASEERGWDNYSTAEGLEHRAEFLEDHLVDPVWQAEVTHMVKLRYKSRQGLARRHPGTPKDYMDDFD